MSNSHCKQVYSFCYFFLLIRSFFLSLLMFLHSLSAGGGGDGAAAVVDIRFIVHRFNWTKLVCFNCRYSECKSISDKMSTALSNCNKKLGFIDWR